MSSKSLKIDGITLIGVIANPANPNDGDIIYRSDLGKVLVRENGAWNQFGSTGIQGATGLGATGLQGLTGAQGSVGIQGVTGISGAGSTTFSYKNTNIPTVLVPVNIPTNIDIIGNLPNISTMGDGLHSDIEYSVSMTDSGSQTKIQAGKIIAWKGDNANWDYSHTFNIATDIGFRLSVTSAGIIQYVAPTATILSITTLSITQGATGSQGIQGVTGAGIQGVTGLGVTGLQGATGAGLQGVTGVSGAPVEVHAFYNNASGTVTNNFSTLITFSTLMKDTHSAFNGTTYTVPVSGVYAIQAYASFAASPSTFGTNQSYAIAMVINGNTTASFANWFSKAPTGVSFIVGSINILAYPLTAGTTIAFSPYCQQAATLNSGAMNGYFSILKVGAY